MSRRSFPALLATFRRQLLLLHAVRVVGLLLFFAALPVLVVIGPPANKSHVVPILVGLLGLWLLFVLRSLQLTREIEAGGVLLSIGKLDEAEVWLQRGLTRFSFSVQTKLVAGELLAALLFRRGAYHDVVTICRELLRHRMANVRNLWVNLRLLLADSLLTLDRLAEADEALRPLCRVPLSLENRMKLLPVRLRYELAAGHSASCASSLAEKVSDAERMDSRGAALVHALLAEACRRENMPLPCAFLAERAHLYHDLADLASRFPVIAPIAERNLPPSHTATTGNER